MVLFDAVQAKGMKEMLMMYLHKLKTGDDLETGLSRHIAGCLNWYSEVLQSGRTRLRCWWMYVQHGPLLNSALRRKRSGGLECSAVGNMESSLAGSIPYYLWRVCVASQP